MTYTITEAMNKINNYKGFKGCTVPMETLIIETTINEKKTPGYDTFSAEGNSRQHFFGHITRWLINQITENQDYWHNNDQFSDVFDILAVCQKLVWMDVAKNDDVNRVILKIAGMIEEGILG